MPGGLDSFLNFAIPIAIFGLFGFMVYKNLKVEIDALIDWMRKNWGKKEEQQPYQIYTNPYLGGETIVYQ